MGQVIKIPELVSLSVKLSRINTNKVDNTALESKNNEDCFTLFVIVNIFHSGSSGQPTAAASIPRTVSI